MLRPETLGRELEAMFDGGARAITVEEVQGPVIRARPRRPSPRRPLILAVAVFVLILVGGLMIERLTRSSSAPTLDETLGGPILPPVELALDHLWPDSPVDMSPAGLAETFAAEALGWESPGGTEFAELEPDGSARVHVQENGIDELVDVITEVSDGGRVITQVGPPWFMGVLIAPLDPEGTRITLLRIGDDVTGEVTVLLSDDTKVVVSARIELGVVDSTFVDLPDVLSETVRSVLIRYVDDTGTVVAANGGSGLSLSSTE